MIQTRQAPAILAVWRRRRLIAAAALALAALTLFVTVPAYSAFDSIYSLVWGQELLDGELPSFDAYRAPTQHPLWVALTTVLAPLGEDASRAVVGICVGGFVALVIGGFRFATAIFGEVVGWIFALLLLSRLDYGFLAARGYIDVPFLALIVWAAATRPTIHVKDSRARRYIPAARTTNDANVAATMRRSAPSPTSERSAPKAMASGCSVGAR